MICELDKFEEIWLVDTEFIPQKGELPDVVCYVGHEIKSSKTFRLFKHELTKSPPFDVQNPKSLFVSYSACAELLCHKSLGWPMPNSVLDLYVEFRNITNGRNPTCGTGLVGALTYFGEDAISAADKENMREKILRGGPWNKQEELEILDYCESDVISLKKLLPHILRKISLPHALLRGEFAIAATAIEANGIPIDTHIYDLIASNRSSIREQWYEQANNEIKVYESGSFRLKLFKDWLDVKQINWPRRTDGQPFVNDDVFESHHHLHPSLKKLWEVRRMLSKLESLDLEIGADGRARSSVRPYVAITSRNQPSTSKFIFGNSSWIRHLIRPSQDRALAYIDWDQQEFGIAAGLSQDSNMIAAYLSGDPYLALAKGTHAVPISATKYTHSTQRNLFKIVYFQLMYGAGAKRLATVLRKSELEAQQLIDLTKQRFFQFWKWIEAAQNCVFAGQTIRTTFGWNLNSSSKIKSTTILNFPMQANGAEMMRIAAINAVRAGIKICAPVHDAFLIESSESAIDEDVLKMQGFMAEASKIVLACLTLRTEAKIIRYPERFEDERGKNIWTNVLDALSSLSPPMTP